MVGCIVNTNSYVSAVFKLTSVNGDCSVVSSHQWMVAVLLAHTNRWLCCELTPVSDGRVVNSYHCMLAEL